MPGEFASAQNLVSVEGIKDGVITLKDGSLRQIVMVGGVNFSLKSEGEQNIITQTYQNFLNTLNFPLQIVVHSRKVNINNYLKLLEERRAQEQSALLQDQIDEYREFVRQFVSEHAIMAKTFFVVVPFSPLALPSKETFLGFLPFRKKKTDVVAIQDQAEKEKVFHENVGQLKQRVAQVTDGLTTIGLETLVLNDEQLLELFYNFYNPETVEKKEAKPTPQT